MQRLVPASVLAIVLGSLAWSGIAFGQEENIARKSVRMTSGDIVETMAVTDDLDAEFGWVLTKGGELAEAGRDRIFRTRLLEPGTYLLDGSARTMDGDKRMVLSIAVSPADGSSEALQPQRLDVVTTDPPMLGDFLPLTSDSPIVALTPASFVSGAITLDLDSHADSDGDGLPGNDNDAAETLFAEEHNTLHLWYLHTEDVGALLLSGQATDGTPLVQRVEFAGEGMGIPAADIVAESAGPASIRFELPLDSTLPRENIVIEWDFGDGRKSLVDIPVHRYAFDGDYEVKATVRDLQTGRVLLETETTVEISGASALPPASSAPAVSSSSSSSASSKPSTGKEGGSILGTLFRIIFFGGIAIALGIAAVWGGKKFLKREGVLQKTLEEAEKKLLAKDAPATDAPPPMELKRSKPTEPQTPTPEAAPEPKPKPEPSPTPTPVKAMEPVVSRVEPQIAAPPASQPVEAPSWLQKGLSAAAETGQTPTNPPPQDIAETPPLVPLPEPQPKPNPQPQPSPPPDIRPPAERAGSSPSAVVPETQNPEPVTPPAVQELPAEPAPQEITDALPEGELLPPWLQTPVQTDTSLPPAEPPVTPLPVMEEDIKKEPDQKSEFAPEPKPSSPISDTSNSPSAIPAPTTAASPVVTPEPPPAPLASTTAEPIVTPEPPPIPLPAPAEPVAVPEPQPSPTPAISPPAGRAGNSPSAIPSADDQQRLDREREKKRKKRMRYRENQKKRREEEVKTPTAAPAPTPSPAQPPTPPAPPPKPQPTAAQTQKPKPTPPAPKPVTKPKPPVVKPIPKPTKPNPQSKPFSKSPETRSPTEASAKVGNPKPATPPPIEKDIPPAASDDSVAFIVRAESVEKQKPDVLPQKPTASVPDVPPQNAEEQPKM